MGALQEAKIELKTTNTKARRDTVQRIDDALLKRGPLKYDHIDRLEICSKEFQEIAEQIAKEVLESEDLNEVEAEHRHGILEEIKQEA